MCGQLKGWESSKYMGLVVGRRSTRRCKVQLRPETISSLLVITSRVGQKKGWRTEIKRCLMEMKFPPTFVKTTDLASSH